MDTESKVIQFYFLSSLISDFPNILTMYGRFQLIPKELSISLDVTKLAISKDYRYSLIGDIPQDPLIILGI
jgi:hypothetical protein